eukprot:5254399-Pyramimonas_sp.AAC.1
MNAGCASGLWAAASASAAWMGLTCNRCDSDAIAQMHVGPTAWRVSSPKQTCSSNAVASSSHRLRCHP